MPKKKKREKNREDNVAPGPKPEDATKDEQRTQITDSQDSGPEKVPAPQGEEKVDEGKAKDGSTDVPMPPSLPKGKARKESTREAEAQGVESQAVKEEDESPEAETEETASETIELEPQLTELRPGDQQPFKLIKKDAKGARVAIHPQEFKWTKKEGASSISVAKDRESQTYIAGPVQGEFTLEAKFKELKAEASIVIKLPKAEWKVEEPPDQSDRVDHTLQEASDIDDEWAFVAASIRGKVHAHKAKWREDSYKLRTAKGWNLIAVADGAGSADLSRIGSKIACEKSIKELSDLVELGPPPVKPRISQDDGQLIREDIKHLKAFLLLAAAEAMDELAREANSRDRSIQDLHTTLLLVMHHQFDGGHLVGAIQVGDGAVGVYSSDESFTLLGDGDHGEFSSETIFLSMLSIPHKYPPLAPLHQRVRFTWKPDIKAIAVMSDGVSDDFFPEKKRLVDLFDGNPCKDMVSQKGDPVKGVLHEVTKKPDGGQALLDWLTYEKKGSSDDRTLALLYRK